MNVKESVLWGSGAMVGQGFALLSWTNWRESGMLITFGAILFLLYRELEKRQVVTVYIEED